MGKFAVADAQLMNVLICKRCKARNNPGSEKCRKCGYRFLRPKNKVVRRKK